jgi:hypothetical protein
VKLVRVAVSESFIRGYEETRRATEFNTVTDPDGRFAFRDVPPGPYRLLWQIPGDSGWIRRLREKPDVWVEEAKPCRVEDINLAQKPVGTTTP